MGASGVEIWGGVECTVNRLGARYLDQNVRLGHHARVDDIDRIASLGLTKVRYPVLWERVAPRSVEEADWTWSDRRLERLRELGIEPILTLLHHGSGPAGTGLLHDGFPAKFAAFAAAVAKRYPWARYYTPLNEPLTTARFSALYGIWYPHAKSDPEFIQALLNEVEGVALAMRAIREVNPQAQLVQTEDLAKTHGVPSLSRQINFENARRWLTYDLQTGSFEKNALMNRYFRKQGFYLGAKDLRRFFCPPDIMGLNYYVTSERYLDDRLQRYDAPVIGGNDEGERYADVPAVRVCIEGAVGIGALTTECWERYHIPIAITEVQLKCTREEQLRWAYEIHSEIQNTRVRGVDVRAMTFWALFGAMDWDSLLTREDDSYEPGAFDIRSNPPRATAVAGFARSLAYGLPFAHPVLDAAGWWRSPQRFTYEPVLRSPDLTMPTRLRKRSAARPLLLLGASESLGQAVAAELHVRNIPTVRLAAERLAMLSDAQLIETLRAKHVWGVIDCSGTEYLGHLWADSGRWQRSDPKGAGKLARVCARDGLRFMRFSGQDVFSGAINDYLESDPPDALAADEKRQAELEAAVREAGAHSLLIRTGVLFGTNQGVDGLARLVRRALQQQPIMLSEAASFSAAYIEDVVTMSLDLFIDDESGIWHLVNGGECDWPTLVREALLCMGSPVRPEADPQPARRRRVVLSSERGTYLEPLEDALERCMLSRRAVQALW